MTDVKLIQRAALSIWKNFYFTMKAFLGLDWYYWWVVVVACCASVLEGKAVQILNISFLRFA